MSIGQPSDETASLPVTLVGDLVALGPAHRGLLSLLWKWESDLELSTLTGDPSRPMTPEAVDKLYDRFSKSGQESTPFVIYERTTMRPIGTVGLMSINHLNRTAELGIGIGERDCWGKGYGTEATRLVLDYAFNVLSLHNVMLQVFSFNERAIRAYRRAGFQEIGRRRQSLRIGEQVFDVVLMDCLSTDFEGSVLRRSLPPDLGADRGDRPEERG